MPQSIGWVILAILFIMLSGAVIGITCYKMTIPPVHSCIDDRDIELSSDTTFICIEFTDSNRKCYNLVEVK